MVPQRSEQMDLLELNRNIPGFQKRINSRQKDVDYQFHIYGEQIIRHTKGTKKKKAITTSKYERIGSNTKGYKNLEWLNKMYDKKMKEKDEVAKDKFINDNDKEYSNYYKVILPVPPLPKGYKLFDQDGKYYGTIMEEDELFYYTAVKKEEQATPFLKDFIINMFIKAQCNGKYGFKPLPGFYEKKERPD